MCLCSTAVQLNESGAHAPVHVPARVLAPRLLRDTAALRAGIVGARGRGRTLEPLRKGEKDGREREGGRFNQTPANGCGRGPGGNRSRSAGAREARCGAGESRRRGAGRRERAPRGAGRRERAPYRTVGAPHARAPPCWQGSKVRARVQSNRRRRLRQGG